MENIYEKTIGKIMQTKGTKQSKGRGQVRSESKKPTRPTTAKQRAEQGERVNGASVYTAVYKVPRSDTLLEFLLRKCNTSRNNVKSLLVRRQVLVNGSVVTQYDFPLAKEDEIKLARKPVREGTPTKAPAEKRVARRKIDLPVIMENEEFIAVNKPEGLLSVESDKETECAYSYLLEGMQRRNKNARPFLLHRIDKETSGVLVFTKDIKLQSMLRMKWNELVVLREYYAVAEGIFEEKSGTVTTYLKENVNNLVYSTNDPTGQKAVTHYEVVRENLKNGYSLVKVKIDTGRKNQIRVHLQGLNHPIVGDDKYGKMQDGTPVRNPLSRLGLHASKLEFIHPVTKEIMAFNAPLPPSFHTLF